MSRHQGGAIVASQPIQQAAPIVIPPLGSSAYAKEKSGHISLDYMVIPELIHHRQTNKTTGEDKLIRTYQRDNKALGKGVRDLFFRNR